MFFDPVYLLFALPGLLLALFASLMTKTTFAKYSQVPASSGMSGAEAAQRYGTADKFLNLCLIFSDNSRLGIFTSHASSGGDTIQRIGFFHHSNPSRGMGRERTCEKTHGKRRNS